VVSAGPSLSLPQPELLNIVLLLAIP